MRQWKKKLWLLVPYALILSYLAFRFLVVSDLSDWRPDSDRHARSYISEHTSSVLSTPRIPSEGDKMDILGIAHSAPLHFQQRDAIRRTWFRDLGPSFKAVFLIGRDDKMEPSSVSLLHSEMEAFGDIIIEDFVDTYNNLTLKSILMLQFVIQMELNIKYLFKMDDDIYLNARRIPELLDMRTTTIGGFRFTQTSPTRYSTVFSYDRKWICPRWMYPSSEFPAYIGGPGYLLPGPTVPSLYHSAFTVPFIHLEDVFITGILADLNSIPRKDIASFADRSGDVCTKNLGALVFHPIRPKGMRVLHDILHGVEGADCRAGMR
uniref:Hexosyltransferase n=1 Tax=Caligus clemensi TaxID=344056 RepID=C1C1R6_CALCM|nr:Beta-1,3-galactosyltransferase 1 [Caligus clemensi]